jgi:hypothetical protein
MLVLIQVAARICLIERLGTSNLFNCTKALRSPLMNHIEQLPRLLRRGSLTLSIDRSRSAISQNMRYTEVESLNCVRTPLVTVASISRRPPGRREIDANKGPPALGLDSEISKARF